MNALEVISVCRGNQDVLLSLGDSSLSIKSSRSALSKKNIWLSGEVIIPRDASEDRNLQLVCNYRSMVEMISQFDEDSELSISINESQRQLSVSDNKTSKTLIESVIPILHKFAPQALFCNPVQPLVYGAYGDKETKPTWLFSILAKDFCNEINKVMYVSNPDHNGVKINHLLRVELSEKGDIGFGCFNPKMYAEIISESAIVNTDHYERLYDYCEDTKSYTGNFVIRQGFYKKKGFSLFTGVLKAVLPVLQRCVGELYLTDNLNSVIIQSQTEDFSMEFYTNSIMGSYDIPKSMGTIARKVLLTINRKDIEKAIGQVGTPRFITLETKGKSDFLGVQGNAVCSNLIPCMTSGMYLSENIKVEVLRKNLLYILSNITDEYITIGLNDGSHAITIFSDGYKQGLMPEFLQIFRDTKYSYSSRGTTSYKDRNPIIFPQTNSCGDTGYDSLYYGEGGCSDDLAMSQSVSISPLKALEQAKHEGGWL